MMQKRVLFEGKLAWLDKNISFDFWDRHWLDRHKYLLYKTKLPWYVHRALAQLPANASIIEAGCGAGFITRALVNRKYKVIGVDFAEKTISTLKSNFPHLEFFCQDIRALSFPDNRFDAYLSLGVIEHFPNEKDALLAIQEAIRITKPGGIIFISVPFTNSLRIKKIKNRMYSEVTTFPLGFYQRAYTEEQFNQLINKLPLKLDKVIYYDAAGGICREITFLNFLINSPVIKAFFYIFNRYTSLVNNYAHMVGFRLINTKFA